MTITLSFDIEEFDFPEQRGCQMDLETKLSVSTEGLEALLLLLKQHGVVATFYVTANFAQHRTELIQRIVAEGHEVASHDFYHAPQSTSNPEGAKQVLEEITGEKIVGFRSPRLGSTDSQRLLAAGYRYNSSLNPTFIPGHYNNLRKPRTRFTEQEMVNYPASVSWPLRVPLFWISLHVMSTSLYGALARTALKKDGHLNLYFHPWEFSERLSQKQFNIPGYLTRCCGAKLLRKLEQLILRWQKAGCKFQTTKDYLSLDE